MPLYEYKCQDCGTVEDHIMTRVPEGGTINEYCKTCDKVTTQDKQVSRGTSFRGNFR